MVRNLDYANLESALPRNILPPLAGAGVAGAVAGEAGVHLVNETELPMHNTDGDPNENPQHSPDGSPREGELTEDGEPHHGTELTGLSEADDIPLLEGAEEGMVLVDGVLVAEGAAAAAHGKGSKVHPLKKGKKAKKGKKKKKGKK